MRIIIGAAGVEPMAARSWTMEPLSGWVERCGLVLGNRPLHASSVNAATKITMMLKILESGTPIADSKVPNRPNS
jgi:hypothetical protein